MKHLFLSAVAAATLFAQPEAPIAPLPPMAPLAPMKPMQPMQPVQPKPAPRPFAFAKGGSGLAFDFQFEGGKDRWEADADRQFERGLRAIDKRQWDVASGHFQEIAAAGKNRADAALYWKALALWRQGKTAEANAALDSLAKGFAQSPWAQEGQKLRPELAGKPLSDDEEEMKLSAMNGLMHSDLDRAVPLLEKLLERRSAPRIQERALQLLAQSNSPKAREVIIRIAKGGANPNLQSRAVRHLGSNASAENRQVLADIYRTTSDAGMKRMVLRSYQSAGDRDRVLTVAKSDADPAMRREAIQILGGMGALAQLSELYATEKTVEVRAAIMQGFMASGGATKLIEIARTEKDPVLRQKAIQYLGGMRTPAASDALVSMYQSESDLEIRRRILRSLAGQDSAKQLIDVAKTEKNPDLRRQAVQHLTQMRSPEATAYLMDLLK